ncbi:MAG: basic rane lipoprotein [Frankiales bacterium]|nr:basic rane lipoprotein [Frankiales bacterium]
MVRKGIVTPIAVLLAAATVLTACSSKPTSTAAGSTSGAGSTTAAGASKITACMVTDTGGIDDRSFNAAAWAGMQAAQSDGKAVVSYVQSKSESDYAPNITALEGKGCKLIVTVGSLMATATSDAAKKDPNQDFAIIDGPGNGTNIKGLQFNVAQSSFLAGYLAAGTTTTGKIATFGGLKFDAVTSHMDGFWEGAQYYNQVKGTHVQVLGWDEKTQNGSFAGGFTDQAKGQQLTKNFIQQGADIIFQVAGGAGLGAAAAAAASNGKVSVIWVDSDGFITTPQYSSVFLTTVAKNVTGAVKDTVEQAAGGGTFSATDYLGTLANGGTGLSPYHDYASKVSATMQSELDQVSKDIISGKIKITSPGQPKVAQ